MRRGGILAVLLTCALVGVFAVAVPPAVSAAPITVPPTVNANSWSIANAAPGPAGLLNGLNSVSCATSNFCMAVGSTSGPPNVTLIEEWNGSTWSVVPGAAGAPGGATLTGVSCVGPTFCAAVGSTLLGDFAEMWNGSSWSLSTASTAGSPRLGGVACTSATFCQAVGSIFEGSTMTFALQWNGTSWSGESTLSPSAAFDYFNGVSCPLSNYCVAVGNQGDGSPTVPLAQLWNGQTWTEMDPPAGPLSIGSTASLFGVSCAGASFCQGVGDSYSGAGTVPLIDTWNGSAWVTDPNLPAFPGVAASLSGVDCFSATTCSAVGSISTGVSMPTLSLGVTWNGSSWSSVPTPNQPSETNTQIKAVSCVTNWSCTAAGVHQAGLVGNPFIMSAPIARSGYRFAASDGGVFNYGAGAPFLGSMGGMPLNKPIVGMAVMPGGDGYDLVASDGGIFNYGSAQFYGSTGSIVLNKPVVGMAVTADGAGYWLVASDGGIFSYGDAQFYGSTGSLHLNKPIVGKAATPDGKG